MGQQGSKHDEGEGAVDKYEASLKMVLALYTRDDKKRAEEEIDGATSRIEEAASSLKEGRAKEALSILSSGVGARCLLTGLKPFVPRLKKIWADGAYTGEKMATWCKERGGWELQIVERSSSDTEGFAVLPHRWIVERTLGWLMRNRRLSKDYERKVQTSETFIEVAMIRLILRRLAREV